MVRKLVRQLVYTMFINNGASFPLCWKENLSKHQKVSKYYENNCRLIDSAICKRQEDQRKHSFLEKKKNSIKGKMDSLWTPRNIIPLDGSCYRSIGSSISQNIFSYLKMLSMQCKKIITIEDNKNRMNITNFINIYRNIYTYITCDKNDSK